MLHPRGFTLVELIVVIIVIAILATVATLGIGKYLLDGRDNQRAANATIIAEALEKYYDRMGEYPGCPVLTSSGASLRNSTLKGVDENAFVTPNAPDGTTNSIQCTNITNANGPDIFSFTGDSSNACLNGYTCRNWTLKYILEGSEGIAQIQSRRSATSP